MVHMGVNTVIYPINKELFHDKEQNSKNMFSLWQGVHDLTHFPVDGEGHGGLPHIKFLIPVMDILCKGRPRSIHELIQFSSEIFRQIHIFIVVYVHDHSINF